MKRSDPKPPPGAGCHDWEVCILAGGLSSRMRRDKTRLRLGHRTLLGNMRATAGQLGVPVRTIRHDLVLRCGPLGGIYTALLTTRADRVLFLPGDMPFVSVQLLQQLRRRLTAPTKAVFVWNDRVASFPFALRRTVLPVVERQLAKKQLSLQQLAQVLCASRLRLAPARAIDLFNINTPEDWHTARQLWRSTRSPAPGKRNKRCLSSVSTNCRVAAC
ncbi:MAG: molybdenum cofactor guanylyltransferase [Limisphaerales bacterium]